MKRKADDDGGPSLSRKGEDPYPAGAAPFESLPLELQLRIVDHLSASDCRALARSCRTWQSPAETVLWRRINVSIPETWQGQPGLHEMDGDRLDWRDKNTLAKPGIAEHIASFRSLEADPRYKWSEQFVPVRFIKLQTRLEQVIRALRNKPNRYTSVKRLVLAMPERTCILKSPDHPLTRLLPDLIALIAPYINTLVITLEPGRGIAVVEETEYSLEELRSLGFCAPFPRLQNLSIPFWAPCHADHSWGLLIRSIARNVIHLTLNEIDAIAGFQCEFPAWLPLALPSIRTVELLGWPILSQESIINIAGSLESLDTACFDFYHQPPPVSDYVSSSIKNTIGLARRKLLWNERAYILPFEEVVDSMMLDIQQEEETAARSGIQATQPYKCFNSIEVFAVNQAIKSESETYIENIVIPPFTNLRAMLVLCRNRDWYRSLAEPGWAKAPPPRSSISPHIVQRLSAAPNLLGVQFGYLNTSFAYVEDHDILDSATWCDRRVNGVLIRSYLHETTASEFYHFRRLELLKVDSHIYSIRTYNPCFRGEKDRPEWHLCNKHRRVLSEGDDGDLLDHRWVDHTSFRGATLPPRILRKVYKIAGEKVEWDTPGRDLTLPEEAWEVLRKWRISLPDRGEVGRRPTTRSMVAST